MVVADGNAYAACACDACVVQTGFSPLDWAAAAGHTTICRLLVTAMQNTVGTPTQVQYQQVRRGGSSCLHVASSRSLLLAVLAHTT